MMIMMVKQTETVASISKTMVLLHPLPHGNGMRCLNAVALYDMQEDAAGLGSSPDPAGGAKKKQEEGGRGEEGEEYQ